MKRFAVILLALGAVALFSGCASQNLGAGPQIEAAKLAVADAKNEGADKLCPQEFQSAELKLRQAELLLQDEEDDQAAFVADQTINLAELAKKCAVARRAHGDDATIAAGPPEALKNFKASIFFDYNSNVIKPDERAKLDTAIAFLNGMAKEHKFYVLLSGYCDPPGTVDDNLELARRRSLVTRFYLTNHGISRSRVYMQALGRGPAARDIDSKLARKKNADWRRVEITVLFQRPANVEIGPGI